jgi:hypothetical protein
MLPLLELCGITVAMECFTVQEHGVKPKVQGQGTVTQSAAAAASSSRAAASRPGAAAAHTSGSQYQQQQQQQQRSTVPQVAPASAQLKPATEFSPFTAVIGALRQAAQSITCLTYKAVVKPCLAASVPRWDCWAAS